MAMPRQYSNVDSSAKLKTPVQYLEMWAQRKPNTSYLHQPVSNGKIVVFTWLQVWEQVSAVAGYLRSLQLPKRANIALLSKNCAHWFMADLAIMLADHVSVPIDATLRAEEVGKLLNHSESAVLFVGKQIAWQELAPTVSNNIVCIALPLQTSADPVLRRWNDLCKRRAPIPIPTESNLDDVATIVYTSGSTGSPKGVMHTLGGMAFAMKHAVLDRDLCERDRLISYLPLSHVAERLFVELASLQSGCAVYFSHDLQTFNLDMRRARPTQFFGVPRVWKKFQLQVLQHIPQKRLDGLLRIPLVSSILRWWIVHSLGLSTLRSAGCGSAPLPQELLAWFDKLGVQIVEGYGMTENFAHSHRNRLERRKLGTVGEASALVETKLSDDGEVWVKSPTNMLGYFKDPDLTRQVLTEDGYLKTGDMGAVDASGHLSLTGRIKDQFKTAKGKYVSPAPIEERLLACGEIEYACVVGELLPQPIALIVLASTANNSRSSDTAALGMELESLLNEINRTLPPQEVMTKLVVLNEQWLPDNGLVTTSLKIKRHAVEKRYRVFLDSWYARSERILFA